MLFIRTYLLPTPCAYFTIMAYSITYARRIQIILIHVLILIRSTRICHLRSQTCPTCMWSQPRELVFDVLPPLHAAAEHQKALRGVLAVRCSEMSVHRESVCPSVFGGAGLYA